MTEINLQDLEAKVEAPSVADKLEQTFEVPEKYKGKSVADVIKMHQEAESALSRQGNELGQYRKLADTLLGLEQDKKSTKEEQAPRVPVTPDDLFAEPDTAINRAVEQNPVVQRASKTAEALERQLAVNEFVKDYPGYENDIQNPKFAEWVQKSPVRIGLAQAADRYDIEAARGLWGLWQEYSESEAAKTEAAEASRKTAEAEARRRKAEEEADLEGSTTGDGTVDTIYDRRKVMDLRIRALKGDRNAEAKLKKLNTLKVYSEKRIK